MTRTKIVATIGPSSGTPEKLEKLVRAGVNVTRLNFSHGSREDHGKMIADIRGVAEKLGTPVAILQDLAGPKVRIGTIPDGPIELNKGDSYMLTSRDIEGNAEQVSLVYKNLPNDVQAGNTLYLADGALVFEVLEVKGEDIRCRVIIGGPLSSHKGINLPDATVSAPILSEKDKADLAFGIEQGVDYVALSFVRNARDVEIARAFMTEKGGNIPIIAKIEKHEALKQIDQILPLVDGIMVARGDLGVEIPIEQVPESQKMLIKRANRAGKPVITATQMLQSMVNNPRPTRAEVTDVANAILDGTDAVMLSEETATGKYPVEAVGMMKKIAAEVEPLFPYDHWISRFDKRKALELDEAVALSACQMADKLRAGAIVTHTTSGSTTRMVSKYRPRRPLIALTSDESTYRRLALVWGTYPAIMKRWDTEEKMIQLSIHHALGLGSYHEGQPIVITAGIPLNEPGITNMIRIVTT